MTSIKAEHFSKTCYDKQPSLEAVQSTARVCGFESRRRNRCLSLVSVVFGMVVVSSSA
jgi:hypothetical protein